MAQSAALMIGPLLPQSKFIFHGVATAIATCRRN